MLRLFNTVTDRQLVVSATSRTRFDFPSLTGGDLLAVEYQALAGNAPSRTGWEILPVSGYSLQIAIYKADGTTQLAYQNTWAAGGLDDIYRGTLALNDAAMTTALASSTPDNPLEAYVQIRRTLTNGDIVTALNPTPILIYKPLISNATASVPPTEQAATMAGVHNLYRPRAGDGTPYTELSPSGYRFAWYIDDDGKFQTSRIS
jgi:hypothetical protein